MRGRKQNERLKSGRTIVAELEQAVPTSDRIEEHKKTERKHRFLAFLFVLMFAGVGIVGYLTISDFYGKMLEERREAKSPLTYDPEATIIDEDNRERISLRTKEYIGRMEQDLQDLGYKVEKVTLPTGLMRTLYVDVVGKTLYIKVNLDRDTAVTAEDAARMMEYLDARDLHPEYVDVRVEGKGYYK